MICSYLFNSWYTDIQCTIEFTIEYLLTNNFLIYSFSLIFHNFHVIPFISRFHLPPRRVESVYEVHRHPKHLQPNRRSNLKTLWHFCCHQTKKTTIRGKHSRKKTTYRKSQPPCFFFWGGDGWHFAKLPKCFFPPGCPWVHMFCFLTFGCLFVSRCFCQLWTLLRLLFFEGCNVGYNSKCRI